MGSILFILFHLLFVPACLLPSVASSCIGWVRRTHLARANKRKIPQKGYASTVYDC